jgi:putative ABC transport system permease protein
VASNLRNPGISDRILGFLGLLLASLGIYGVVSYAVSSRTREIGIRMTLGANSAPDPPPSHAAVGWGLLIGFAVCAALSRLMSVMLYGISPFDSLTLRYE